MEERRKIFYLLAFWLLFGSCAKQDKTRLGPEITVGIEASPSSLDPRLARDAYAIQIMPLVFPGLFRIGADLEPEPDLADFFEQTDALTFVFHLRQGMKFSNGQELTSEDVKATLESLNAPGLNSPYLELAERIRKIEVLDRASLRLELKEPYAPLLVELNLGIIPAEQARKSGLRPEELSGAGAYRILRWVPGTELVLTRNEFRSGSKPYFERIVFRIIPEDLTRLMSLEKGEIQLLQSPIPVDELGRLKRHAGLAVKERPGLNYSYMGFNLRDPILSKRQVREAIAHALNRDELIHCLLKDSAVKVDTLLSPRHWAYEPLVKSYDYDPVLARKLLDEAGYPDPDGDGPGHRFKLSYKTSQNVQRLWIAQAIARELDAVGIEVEVRSLEWGTLFSDIQAGNFQIYTMSWVGVVEPDIFYTIFHSQSLPPQGANRGFYANPEIDALVAAGRMTQDRGARRIIYSRVQKILSEDLPYVSLWNSLDITVSDKRLLGFELGPAGEWSTLQEARWGL